MQNTHLVKPHYNTGGFIVYLCSVLFLLLPVLVGSGTGVSIVFFVCGLFMVSFFLTVKSPKESYWIQLISIYFAAFLCMPVVKISQNFAFVSVLSGFKDIVLFGAVLAALIRFRKKEKLMGEWAVIQFLAVYVLYFVVSPKSVASLASFREVFSLVLYYLIGRYFYGYFISYKKMISAFVFVAAVMAVFGIVERFFWSSELWSIWGASDFFMAKFQNANFTYSLREGLPKHWFTFSGDGFDRRLVSTVGDATSAARSLSAAFVFVLIAGIFSFKLRLFILPVLSVAILLTLGRGGMLVAAIGLAGWVLLKNRAMGVLASLGIVVAAIFMSSSSAHSGNFDRHVTGLVRGVGAAISTPFGHGLGTSGTMAIIYSSGHDEERVEESMVGSIGYQVGAVGLLSYFVFFSSILRRVGEGVNVAKYSDRSEYRMKYCLFTLLLGVFVTSFLASSALSPVAAAPAMMIAGAYIGKKQRSSIYARGFK